MAKIIITFEYKIDDAELKAECEAMIDFLKNDNRSPRWMIGMGYQSKKRQAEKNAAKKLIDAHWERAMVYIEDYGGKGKPMNYREWVQYIKNKEKTQK